MIETDAEGGRVFVAKVDLHGSAWEAGLKAGDEITALAIDRRLVLPRDRDRQVHRHLPVADRSIHHAG